MTNTDHDQTSGEALDPNKLRKIFDDWWGTGSTIVVSIAGALATANVPTAYRYPIAVLAFVLILVSFYFAFKKRLRRDKASAIASRKLQQPIVAGTIRGLKRFRKGELLPGQQRRIEAAQLLLEVKNETFDVGIVTGDSGAGKSSLLEAGLCFELEQLGYVVAMLNGSNFPFAQNAGSGSIEQGFSQLTSFIDQQLHHKRDSDQIPGVLIMDQFEELFGKINEINDREKFGLHLASIMKSGWKLVIGIRKEFLSEIKDVAKGFARPIALQDTIIIRNFDVNEAADVIRECTERDGIACAEELPAMIANDLTTDGTVRPADLQIVCRALHGDLTVDRYASEGRAAGLRSRFVAEIVDVTGHPDLARTILRSLCDIANNKKNPIPLTAKEIADRIQANSLGFEVAVPDIDAILSSFEQAYFVVRSSGQGPTGWSLIHDYLVEPIKLATEQQATLSEAAVAELEYFSHKTASGGTIPFDRLMFIRRNAPPGLLLQPVYRRLIVKSLFIGYGKPAGWVLAASTASFILVILAATEWNIWRPIDAPLNGFESPGEGFQAVTLDKNGKQIALIDSYGFGGTSRASVWDTLTGKKIFSDEQKIYSITFPPDGAIWSDDPQSRRLTRWEPLTDKRVNFEGPIHNRPLVVSDYEQGQSITLSDSHGMESENLLFDLKLQKWSKNQPFPKSSFSTYQTNGLQIIESSEGKSSPSYKVSIWSRGYRQKIWEAALADRARLVASVERGNGLDLVFFLANSELKSLRLNKKGPGIGYEVIEGKTVKTPSDFLPVGRGVDQESAFGVFNALDKLVVISAERLQSVKWNLDPSTLELESPEKIDTFSGDFSQLQFDAHELEFLRWRSENGAGVYLWFNKERNPTYIPVGSTEHKDIFSFSKDHRKLLIFHADRSAHLWAIDPGKQKALQLASIDGKDAVSISFTGDDKALVQKRLGGTYFAWSSEDGRSLGRLGVVGSEPRFATFNAECQRFFIWTEDGQRLELRRGNQIPLYGFMPWHTCS